MSTIASAQPTLFRQTVTFLSTADAPQIQIDVAGPKSANTITKLFLEFGPDGKTVIPPPNPGLPGSMNFQVTGTSGATPIGAANFPPSGGFFIIGQPSDPKTVALTLPHPLDAPGFYVLAITHLQDVANGATEHWTLQLNGLQAAVRVIGAVDQGSFAGLKFVVVVTTCNPTGPNTCVPTTTTHCCRILGNPNPTAGTCVPLTQPCPQPPPPPCDPTGANTCSTGTQCCPTDIEDPTAGVCRSSGTRCPPPRTPCPPGICGPEKCCPNPLGGPGHTCIPPGQRCPPPQ